MPKSLQEKAEQIDYDGIIRKHPWILKRNQRCILSPDSDGLLCGLFMSHFLNWKIKGFYDGKVLLLEKDVSAKDCIFLDMEIFRKNARSVGHHMVQFNKRKKPRKWDNFESAIQPNNLRDYDGYRDFKIKYPFGTIHLLIGIIENGFKVNIPVSAICPLLYTDGVFKNLFGYPDNCIDWLYYLGAENKSSNLHKIFFNDHYSIYDLMLALSKLFLRISNISDKKRGNDKIQISNKKGEVINFVSKGNLYALNSEEKKKAEAFLDILSGLTKWRYRKENWVWSNFVLRKFDKKNIKPTNSNFEKMIRKNPISWAMTKRDAIEYTLDPNNHLFE